MNAPVADWSRGLGLGRALINGASVVILRRDGDAAANVALVGGRSFDDLPTFLEAAEGDPAMIQFGDAVEVPDAELLSPVGAPRKILCMGRNYLDHVREGGRDEAPELPELFPKWSTSLNAPYADVVLPHESEMIDYETEFVIVMGRAIRRASAEEAAAAIFGFTVGNDGSVRDWQFRSSQAAAGKAWDGLSPLGPVVVPAAELGVAPDLAITGTFNGDIVQSSRTSNMIYDAPRLVSYVSTFLTLEPGDLLFTGTPAGVGAVRNPPLWLADGVEFEARIEGIGAVRNRWVNERTSTT